MAWQQFHNSMRNTLAVHLGLLFGLSITALSPSAAFGQTTAEDAIYLYGTTSTAEQIGHEYMVIQFLEEDKVKGAFYQINSEFACFSGEIAEGALKLAVIDTYEQVAYDYQMNYQSTTTLVADNGDRHITQFIPEGFYAIDSGLDEQGEHALGRCATDSSLEV